MNPEALNLTLESLMNRYDNAKRDLWIARNVGFVQSTERINALLTITQEAVTAVKEKCLAIMGDTDDNLDDILWRIEDLSQCWDAMMAGRCGEGEYRAQRKHFIDTITGAI